MLKQLILSIIFLAGSIIILDAQTIESWITANEKNPVEKIYIHTDAENYFTGDTLWFNVYLTDSHSGQLIPRAENVYVNLFDESGQSVKQSILLSVNGQVSGHFVIGEKTRSGNFLLQAHSNYLLNFGPESYFYKQLTISKIAGSSRSYVKGNKSGKMVADVTFFPEGGILLENSNNLVAYKAVDQLGLGVDVHGSIKDEKGTVIATFTSDYRGMGLFFLSPEAGKSYFATVDGFPSFRYKFEPVQEGIKIQLVNHTSKEVIINVARNFNEISEDTFYLVNMYRGEVLFYQSFKIEGVNKVFKFESNSLNPGINKLVLLDKMLKPVSERYLFCGNFNLNNLMIATNENVFGKREPVKLMINDVKYLSDDDFSSLTVSVIHQLVIPEKGFSKNILSEFFIDSELRGFVESSADFFSDTEISSEAKLRLLMLTTDKASYFWNQAPGKTEELKFKQESGINLKGIAKNILTNNIIPNGEITMAIQKDDEVAFITQKTDSLGHFIFTGLLFNDTASVHVQAKNESGKMNIDMEIEPVFQNEEPAQSQFKLMSEKITEQSKLAALKYQIYSEKRKSQSKVKQSKNKKNDKENTEDDGHFRLYESADYVLNVEPFEQSYNNILDFIVGKIPGVDISGDNVRIRGTSSFVGNTMPLFLLDGVPLVGSPNFNLPVEVSQTAKDDVSSTSKMDEQLIQTVRAIPLSDVDKIEILKSSQNTAVYGVKGANGVIAIYTRRGEIAGGNSVVKGIVSNKVAGYPGYKEFYSPDYSKENVSRKQPDLRTLLYWNPEIKTKNGAAEYSFFSSDQTGYYKIIVEGITNDGRICVGSTEIQVK